VDPISTLDFEGGDFVFDFREFVVFEDGALMGFFAGTLTAGCLCDAGPFVVTVVLLDVGGLTAAGVFATVDLPADEVLLEVVLLPEITTVLPTTFDE
jgi:hypothetical protein